MRPALSDISLKALKATLAVARQGNVSRAAQLLNRSQTAVSKAVSGLESRLGVTLFDRTPSGLTPTDAATALTLRVAEAQNQLDAAATAYRDLIGEGSSLAANPVFSLGVSQSRYQALLMVEQCASVKEAAARLGSTGNAVYNSINTLEKMLGTTLFVRRAHGSEPTPFCRELCQAVQLALTLLTLGIEEAVDNNGEIRGELRVAAMPSVRQAPVPQACIRVKQAQPGIHVLLKDGMFPDLARQLRSGELDMIISALFPDDMKRYPDLDTEVLFNAPVTAIARWDHPLFTQHTIKPQDVKTFPWVLPHAGTGARRWHEQILQHWLGELPRCDFEAYSYSMLRELLIHTDAIAFTLQHQVAADQQQQMVRELPVNLHESMDVGLVMRRSTTPSRAANLMRSALHETSEQLLKQAA